MFNFLSLSLFFVHLSLAATTTWLPPLSFPHHDTRPLCPTFKHKKLVFPFLMWCTPHCPNLSWDREHLTLQTEHIHLKLTQRVQWDPTLIKQSFYTSSSFFPCLYFLLFCVLWATVVGISCIFIPSKESVALLSFLHYSNFLRVVACAVQHPRSESALSNTRLKISPAAPQTNFLQSLSDFKRTVPSKFLTSHHRTKLPHHCGSC